MKDYVLRILDDSAYFNESGWVELEIEILVVNGEPIMLCDGSEHQVTIGAKVFTEDKKIVGEFRCEKKEICLSVGEKSIMSMLVFVDPACSESLTLNIDIVKEHSYWFEDMQLTSPLRLPIRKNMYISNGVGVDGRPLEKMLSKLKEEISQEYRKRDERSEVIIFSLLNSLKKVTEKEL